MSWKEGKVHTRARAAAKMKAVVPDGLSSHNAFQNPSSRCFVRPCQKFGDQTDLSFYRLIYQFFIFVSLIFFVFFLYWSFSSIFVKLSWLFFIFEIHLQCQPSRIRMSLRTIWGVTQPTCLSPPQLPQGGHQDLSKKANKFHHCKVCFFSGACTFLHSGRNIMDSRKSWGGCRAWVLCSGSRSSITPLPFSILPHCSLAFKGVLKSTKDGKMLS